MQENGAGWESVLLAARPMRTACHAVALVLVAVAALEFSHSAAGDDELATVTRVVDGDTLLVDINGRKEHVRLIGVDTPETVHPQKPVERFGKEASEFTRRMAEGKRVRLERGKQTADRDRYGRLLRYVYLPDGTVLNAEIIAQGYGFAYVKYAIERMEEFRRLEREARVAGRGLWAAAGDAEQ